MEKTIRNYRIPNIMAVFALVGLVMMAYLRWARPYQLRWGATDEEVQRPMPGDELNPNPKFLATRAITIEGKPQDVWLWLVQMGYRRAGFYGYDILENLGSPRGIRSADRILPEFQHFTVGDEVPISPAGGLVFYAIEPTRYLIWSGYDGGGGFTWALYPVDEKHTRLVSRIRWSHNWRKPSQLGLDLFTEFTDHLAVRKILQGVKGRVEGRIEPMAQANTEFALYLAAAWIFLGAIVLILLRPLTWRRWLAGLAAGAAWLITWYAPISTRMGAHWSFWFFGASWAVHPASVPHEKRPNTAISSYSQSVPIHDGIRAGGDDHGKVALRGTSGVRGPLRGFVPRSPGQRSPRSVWRAVEVGLALERSATAGC